MRGWSWRTGLDLGAPRVGCAEGVTKDYEAKRAARWPTVSGVGSIYKEVLVCDREVGREDGE